MSQHAGGAGIGGLGDLVQVTAAQEQAKRDQAKNKPNFAVHDKKLKFAKNSLFCLDESSSFRWSVVWLIAHPVFELVILLLIIANSIVLAMTNYSEVTANGQLDTSDPFNRAVDESELVFTTLFAIEMVLKIIAMGFVLERGAYLRDPWNVLDFIVVMAGLLGLIPGLPNVSALRAIRVLRPLRSLTIVPGMRLLVMSLLRSIPALLEVLLLLLFAFAIFGILGLQLWAGLFHARCRLTEAPVRMVGAPQGFPSECLLPIEQCSALFMSNASGAAALAAAKASLEAGADGAAAAYLASAVRTDAGLGMRVAAEFNSTGLVACLPGQPVESGEWSVREDSPWFTPQPCFWPVDAEDERICTLGGLGEHTCGAGRFCGSNYDSVQNPRFVNELLTRWDNRVAGLNWGLTSFDHILVAVLSIFQSITMEGWTTIMYMVMDSYNGVVGGVYFVVLILFGSFFLLNLLLAVIWEQFSESQKQEEEDKARLLQEKEDRDIEDLRNAGMRRDSGHGHSHGDPTARSSGADAKTVPSGHPAHGDGAGLGGGGGGRESNDDSASGVRMGDIGGCGDATEGRRMGNPRPSGSDPKVPDPNHRRPAGSSKVAPMPMAPAPAPAAVSATGARAGGVAEQLPVDGAVGGQRSAQPLRQPHSVVSPGTSLGTDGFASDVLAGGASPAMAGHRGGPAVVPVRRGSAPEGGRAAAGSGWDQAGEPKASPDASAADAEEERRRRRRGPRLSANATMIVSDEIAPEDRERAMRARELEAQVARHEITVDEAQSELRRMNSATRIRRMPAWQRFFHDLAVAPMVNFLVMVAIIVNTSVLAADHHPMEPDVAAALEVVNFVLTVLFTLEMIVKVVGLGPRRYVRDPFNAFDALIVITTLVEVVVIPPSFLTATTEDIAAGGGGISALRTFRLFRVFALAKQWTSLRVLLHTILRTLKDVAYFAVLLLLFMFIFSLIGMQFFANQLCFDPVTGLKAEQFQGTGHCPEPFERPRAHFDDLLWAFVTVFQVLTGEDWNSVMYLCWLAVGWPATLYFIALVIIGNFMILNLFLAILLGNFEGMEELVAQPDEDRNASVSDVGSGSNAGIGRVFFRLRNALTASKTSVRVGVTDSQNLDGAEGASGAALKQPPIMLESSTGRSQARLHSQGPARGRRESEASLEGGPDGAAAGPRDRAASRHVQFGPGGKSGDAGAGPPRLGRSKTDGQQPDASAGRGSRDGVDGSRGDGASLQKMSTSAMLARSGSVGGSDPSVVRRLREKKRLFGNALFFLPPTNPWRQQLGKLVQSDRFENIILVLIVVSSIALALDTPLADPTSDFSVWLRILDIVFTALFTLEMVLKILAFGFALHKNAYLRDPWNIIDFCIVIVSLVSIAAVDNPALKSLRTLRTLRALRPLRMVSRNKGMRLVVNALFSSMPAILNVLFVCLLFFLIFGIIGVSYFKGAFGQCGGDVYDAAPPSIQSLVFQPIKWPSISNATRNDVLAIAGTSGAEALQAFSAAKGDLTSEEVCAALGMDWSLVVPSNFDNIWFATGTLVEMATTEGWMDVLHAGVDSRGLGMQPRRDANPGWAAFFVAFMVVGNFFVLNLFVGVVIDNFNRMKVKLGVEAGQSIFATPEQREWQKTRKYALLIRPFKKEVGPTNPCRRATLALVRDPRFEWFIVGCILLNTGAMAATFFGQPTAYSTAMEIINYVFAGIFTIEAILKISAMGCKYFRGSEDSAWNIFDFVIVLGTNIGIILQLALGLNVGSVATVVRTFRVGRIFRLVQRAKKIQFYFSTLIQTLPSLGNIGGLLFLLFFIYAVMGVQLFAEVRQGDSLDQHANFQSFGRALLTLMRASTGEAWNYIMYEAAATTPGCRVLSDVPYSEKRHLCGFNPDPRTCVPLDGCGNSAAYVYFYSFTVIVTFVFLNLFIAVVLEAFSDTSEEEAMKLKKADFATLADAWLSFDPGATCLMPASKLPSLMRKLRPPLGFEMAVRNSDARLRRAIRGLAIQIHRPAGQEAEAASSPMNRSEGGSERILMVHFADVAQSLSQRVFDEAARTEGKEGFVPPPRTKQDERELLRAFGRASFGHATAFDFESYAAAEAIERLFKAYKFRKKIDSRIEPDPAVPPVAGGSVNDDITGRSNAASFHGQRGAPQGAARKSPRAPLASDSNTGAATQVGISRAVAAGARATSRRGVAAPHVARPSATGSAGGSLSDRPAGQGPAANSGHARDGQLSGRGGSGHSAATGPAAGVSSAATAATEDDDGARRARMAGPPTRLAGGDDHDVGVDDAAGAPMP
ncbi:hypothetical protein FNF28_05910 [Cafeteria roenbergensis]|uniref:Calcium-channel protein CCH1 n=1 Tax=Cafeteria roenbergensis TaxID=33653 RepID=A0A5A8D248_CAFRO|nr:hypothetical protein FNF28_05910 [Cafeteria roenbergensis]